MLFSKLIKKLNEDSESKSSLPINKKEKQIIKPEVDEREQEDNELRSNIDQYWKNPADLSHDLSLFLKKIKSSDYKLYMILVNHINAVMSNFKVQRKDPDLNQ